MDRFPALARNVGHHGAMRAMNQRPELRYGSFILTKGDNDAKRIWGGVRHGPAAPSTDTLTVQAPVAALQTDLAAVGVYTLKIDGDFGAGTDEAVQRFQWNAKTVPFRLKGGRTHVVSVAQQTYSEDHSGVLTPKTVFELSDWLKGGFVATGDLVRMGTGALAGLAIGGGFRKLANSTVVATDLVVSRDIVDDVKAMNTKAVELGITISLNQGLRVVGIPVSGAVVKPRKSSMHLIGHAIDCNIHDGTKKHLTSEFEAGTETQNAKDFIKAMKDRGMRWGGNFAEKDYPHFDRWVGPKSDAYRFKYYFNQRMISEGHPIAANKG